MTLKELSNIINTINEGYKRISSKWEKVNTYKYNQSSKLVSDILTNESIDKNIKDYLSFLNMASAEIYEFSKYVSRVRIKNINSYINKIYYYIREKEEHGKVPIKKCINDLFGLRIITDNYLDFVDINNLIVSQFPFLKCTEKNSIDYKATHIYFVKDNYNYQWELQIWYKGDEESNLLSHAKHKQQYTNWEYIINKEQKEG